MPENTNRRNSSQLRKSDARSRNECSTGKSKEIAPSHRLYSWLSLLYSTVLSFAQLMIQLQWRSCVP